jgi:lysophospholipase L1-like esterase
MRSSRILAVAIAMLALGADAILVVAVNPDHAPAVHAAGVHYVALGDSYASGLGSGDTTGSCDQSPNAYPALWAKANSPASFTFAACEGATTSDVVNSQLSVLNSSTTLVSITIGGNDLGFSSFIGTCALKSTSACVGAIASAGANAGRALPGEVNTTLADIHAHAPNAKIVVVGYPDFYAVNAGPCPGPLSLTDRQALDAGINALDGILKAVAAANGDMFVDVRSQFSANELCGGDSSWLDALGNPFISSFHPTAVGQKEGYLPLFIAAAAKANA